MTVSTTNITSGPYTGNALAATFSYTFKVTDKAELEVYETDDGGAVVLLGVDTDYTVAGIGDDEGGLITRVAGPLPTDYQWFIRANYRETQLTPFTSQGAFFPDLHESAMDKLTFLIQQLLDETSRSPSVSKSYNGALPLTLPMPAAGESIRWLGDLSGFENYNTVSPALVASGQLVMYTSVAAALADTSGVLVPGIAAHTEAYYGGWATTTEGPLGGAEYLVVTKAQHDLARNTATVNESGDHTLPSGDVLLLKIGNEVIVSQFGAPRAGDATAAFIAAGTYLLGKTDPGGTIRVDAEYNVTADAVSWWDILSSEQGVIPTDDFLPNGELVRGTYLAMKGDGYERSKINVIGAGDGFVWGNFTSIANKRAMSGHVDGIDFLGSGVAGHTAQVIIDNGFGQSFTTTTTAGVGTTNVATRCLVFEECVPNTFVTNCRFRQFQEAIHQTYGFGFQIDACDIQWCNIGAFFDAGVTTWEIRAGNEIEVCAVGVFSKNTSNGHIGGAVIEANTAGCDVLVWISKFLSIEGAWFEGSLQNVVALGDLTAPSLPNSGWVLSNIVGLNIDNNGGMVNFHAENCAMNILGESFSANTGEQFGNVVYENCTLNEGPFDASTLSVSGIATLDDVKIKGGTVDGGITNYQSRENLVKKAAKSAASSAGNNTCFTLEIDNEVTTGRIEIEGYWRTDPANDYQMYTFKYVGVISRNTGGASVVTFLANESASTLYPATGTNVPNLPTLPNTTVTGGVGATQEVTVEFALGTAVGQSADTLYTATIMNQTDGIRFK